MADYDYIRQLHKGITPVPVDGSAALYAPAFWAKRNVNTEREFLVKHRPLNVVRNGREFIYTLDTGQKYSSFYKPHEIQWTPGP